MQTPGPAHRGCVALDAFNQLPAGLLVLDAEGEITQCNPEAGRILGHPPEALPGEAVGAVLTPVELMWDLAESGDRGEAVVRTPTGERLVGYSVGRGDDAAPLVVLCQDLTAVRRLREERDRLLRMATVGEVLPTVLHELRNPLAAVTSAMEVLVEDVAEGESPANMLETMHSMLNELRRMSLVFQGIGVVGRSLRSGAHGAVDLAIEEAVRIMGIRAERTGVRLTCDCRPMPLLPFEPSVVRAVVFNLINNALQACDHGQGVHVSARFDRRHGLLVQVADTGKGMSAEVLAKCTRPFFTTRHSGSGLGLVICSEAVQEAGGQFEIESRPGEGTTVSIAVPLEPPVGD